MKRFLSFLLALAIIIACAPVIPLQVNASETGVVGGEFGVVEDPFGPAPTEPTEPTYSGTCGENVTWTLDENGTMIVSGSGSVTTKPWKNRLIKNLIIEDGVSVGLGNEEFYDNKNLVSVVLGNGVRGLGFETFAGCSNLLHVTLGDGITSIIEDFTFYGSGLKSLIIGDGLTGIPDNAFFGMGLISVSIGNNVTSIGADAFFLSYELESINIPGSVTSIGEYAFESCESLTDVYYAGTQAQWDEITIMRGNEALTRARIHFNHAHDYSLFEPEVVPATCTQMGYTQYTCAYGETFKTEYTPALGHDYSGTVTVIAPTCTEKGYTETQCIRCTETKKINYTNALGHNCPSVETVKEPSCTMEGVTTGLCTNCGETIEGTIDALGHKMVALPAVDATCTEDGLTVGTKCERCDFVGIAQTTVSATGHSFADGACTGCGLEGIALHKQDDVETYYNTLEEALAVTGGTIQLLADVTGDVVSINPGVVLDLNGYTLTASSVEGKVMDSSDGKGLVKVGVKNAVLSSNDDQLILWDNATENPGYRVFNYTFTNMGMDAHKDDATESAKRGTTLKSFWSDLVFTNPYAYTLAASAYSTLSVGFEVSWTPEGGAATSKTFTFGTSVVADWGAAEESNAGDKNYCFYIGLTGFDDLLTDGTVEVKPVVKTAFNTDEAESTQIKYDYVKPAPGGLVYEYGFGNLNK